MFEAHIAVRRRRGWKTLGQKVGDVQRRSVTLPVLSLHPGPGWRHAAGFLPAMYATGASAHQGGRVGCAEEIRKKQQCESLHQPGRGCGRASLARTANRMGFCSAHAGLPSSTFRPSSISREAVSEVRHVAECPVFLSELRWEVLSVPATRRLVPAGEHEVEPCGSPFGTYTS